MRRKVCDIDAPGNRTLDLCPALAQHFLWIGVFPKIVDRAGESGLATQERWGVRDGAESVRGVFAVEREMNANVVGDPVAQRGVAGPRCWHHQRCARCDTTTQGEIDALVGGVARAEIVARDDGQAIGDAVSQSFSQGAHQRDATGCRRPKGPDSPLRRRVLPSRSPMPDCCLAQWSADGHSRAAQVRG